MTNVIKPEVSMSRLLCHLSFRVPKLNHCNSQNLDSFSLRDHWAFSMSSRPFRTRRSHQKSRLGCAECKRRRIKVCAFSSKAISLAARFLVKAQPRRPGGKELLRVHGFIFYLRSVYLTLLSATGIAFISLCTTTIGPP